MRRSRLGAVSSLLLFGAAFDTTPAQTPPSPAATIDGYDVVWRSPSRDASGSMPIGNGEVGANVWVEPDGRLCCYVSRTDSFSEASRLLKLGKVELQVRRPEAGEVFEQRLSLRDGAVHVTWGAGERQVQVRVFVDCDRDLVHIDGDCARPEQLVLRLSTWRRAERRLQGEELKSSWTMQDAPDAIAVIEGGDRGAVVDQEPPRLGFCHRNQSSVVPLTLAHQSLPPIDGTRDPLLHRTFGLVAGGVDVGRGSMRDPLEVVLVSKRDTHFAFHVAAPCVQDADETVFATTARALLATADTKAAAARTSAFWQALHARSWILVDGDPRPTQAVPKNDHPLRIGVDSGGGNRFVGSIGDLSLRDGPVGPNDLERQPLLVNTSRQPLVRTNPGAELPLVLDEQRAIDLARGLQVRATITVAEDHPIGRIVDKVTAGTADGFLFDTHPGNSLRLIVGHRQLLARDVLTPGKQHEVLASYDGATGRMLLLCDGKLVADSGVVDAMPTSPLTQALLLQRHVQASGGRGNYPIKFNGSIFTVEPSLAGGPAFDADWRRWGDCFWWQNTRLPYHAMLAQGDFAMLEPLFQLYERTLPLAQARARAWHDVAGAFWPETMTPFGTHANKDYGWDRTGHQPRDVLCPWWCYAWNQGPELVALMLDRHDYAPDAAFVRNRLVPFATAMLAWFDHRFPRDEQGRLLLTPTQSIETYWHGVANDLPTVVGLHDVLERLLRLPGDLVADAQRESWRKLHAILPAVPLRGDGDARVIAPAERFDDRRSNCENPELYAVWPFRRFGLGRPDLEVAQRTFSSRHEKMTHGWTQDGQQAALLGLVDEASSNLLAKVANHNRAFRSPVMWGPNFDWLPDQCHGSNLLITTQCMLLQPVGERLLLLPCWPPPWNVSFRLHAPRATVVELDYRDGKVARLDVTPAERRATVVLPAALAAEATRLGVGHLPQ
ncbi:MAG: hypothetical protein IPK26_25030 [Planctomycetes bacterium]|nr:hypothetical protein [Planctomycetota bacterium]